MNWTLIFVLLAGVVLGFLSAAPLARIRSAPVPEPRPRLVVVDGNGPIIGRPSRAQWRLRRRALLEAAEICDQWADGFAFDHPSGSPDAEACARNIRDRVREYDQHSPEFSELWAEPQARSA